jgi:hypothetical protein
VIHFNESLRNWFSGESGLHNALMGTLYEHRTEYSVPHRPGAGLVTPFLPA